MTVLHGVDLAVQRGATLAIVGASGSGNSTPVSYTHLDVYKRQVHALAGTIRNSDDTYLHTLLATLWLRLRSPRGRWGYCAWGFVPV